MLLTESIGSVAVSAPERPAVIDARGATSYGRLVGLAAAYASAMRKTPDQALVGALCEPSAEFIALYLAAIASQRVLVPFNERIPDQQLLSVLADSDCAMVFCQRPWAGRAEKLAAACGDMGAPRCLEDIEPADPGSLVFHEILGPRDRVACFYTSGMTGDPMGAVLTHGNLSSTVETMLHLTPVDETDVFTTAVPLWHVYSVVVGCLLPLTAGARIALCPTASAECVSHTLELHGSTFVVAPPTVLSRLGQSPETGEASRLRFALSGGDSLPVEVLGRFEERYGVPVVESYGLTEGSAVSTCNPFGGDRRPGTVGRALPNQTLRIADDRMTLTPMGDVGEIIIRGPNVMSGYLGRARDTMTVMRDGWLHTGDLGWMDPLGFLHLVGRKKDLIIVDGLNVYPGHVERVLQALDGILEACVVGVKEPDRGEVPKAVVVLDDEAQVSDEDILEHCRGYLAEYETPQAILRVPRLPKTTAGHLSRATVSHLYGRSLAD
jgi:acyl-CoA synthetase (AMP-forming)/AMP-acid ligase II